MHVMKDVGQAAGRGRGQPRKERDPEEEGRIAGKCSDPGKGSVPNMGVGYCLGSEKNGVWERGVRAGPGRQKGES
jgi:hypothetical protein